MTSIGNYAFWGCSGLINLVVDENNPKYSSENDILYNKDKTKLIYCATGKVGEIQIADTTTKIEAHAFDGCSGLTGELTIPDSVTSIGEYAFQNCIGLEGALIIPDSVTSIGGRAFENCSSFTGTLNIPDSVTTIGERAFWDCKGITKLVVEENNAKYSSENDILYSKDKSRLIYCATGKVGKIQIPDTTTKIDTHAFYGCSGLTGDLTIPDSVTSIGARAFSDCRGLTGDLIIPDSLTKIEHATFYNCRGLTGDLVIPDSVTSIGEYAVSGCSNLTDIFIDNTEEYVLNLQQEGTWDIEWKGNCTAVVHYSDCIHSINFFSDDELALEEVSASKVDDGYECESVYRFKVNNIGEDTGLEKRIQVTKKVSTGTETTTEIMYADESGVFTINRLIRDLSIKAEEKNKQVVVVNKTATGKVISEEIVYGYLGDSYEIVQQEIEGYTAYGSMPENSTGTYTDEAIAVELTYEPNIYTIDFDTNGGNEVASKTGTYDDVYGELEVPTREGYTFVGWYLDEELTQKVDKDTIVATASNHTIYAKWEINEYTVTFTAEGQTVETITKNYKETIAVSEFPEVPEKEGYTGVWNKEEDIILGASDETVEAIYTANEYTASFDTNGGSTVSDKIVTFDDVYGELEQSTKEGYTFKGWYLDEGLTQEVNKDTIVKTENNHTIYAKWEANQYTVTFDANGGSAVSDKTVTYDGVYGQLEEPTKEGYTFAGWYLEEAEDNGTGIKVGENNTVKIAGNHTIYAKWEINEYTVTFIAEGQTVGTITKNYKETIAVGEFPEVPIKEGYTGLWNKQEDIVLGANDETVEAIYTANGYTVTFDTNGGNEITPKFSILFI